MATQVNGHSVAFASDAPRRGPAPPDPNPLQSFPFLRSVLAPEYAFLPAEQLEAFMESEYGEGAAELYDEYFESFFGDVGKFVKKAAPVAANIGGGIVKGATTGSALGPFGMIGGALAGGVGQGFASYGKGPLRNIGKGINTGLGAASQFSPLGRVGGSLGGALSGIGQGKNVLTTALGAASGLAGGGALGKLAGPGGIGALTGLLGGGRMPPGALGSMLGGQGGAVQALTGLLGGGRGQSPSAQLAGLLQRPEMLRALGAMSMGQAGRKSIPVGAAGTPVPASAFASLLGMFAQSAADEQAALSDGSESNLTYLMDDAGEWVVDPAESDERAAYLYELLTIAELERLVEDAQLEQWQHEQEWQRQQQWQQQAAARSRLREARSWQQHVDQESAMYDAMDLAETFALGEDTGEVDEFDEIDLEAVIGEFDEFDEFDKYDEYDDVA